MPDMHCQAQRASSTSCRCHECHSLLCMDRWTDHYLEEHGQYPQELDLSQGNTKGEAMGKSRDTGLSDTRVSGSGSGLSHRSGGSSVPQKSKRSPPPKATERTNSTSSCVIFTPASSHHLDSRHIPEQQSRASGTVRGGDTGRVGTAASDDYTMEKYLGSSDQPWSLYNMRSGNLEQKK
ncbi:hypothetical protein BC567DRAFT_16852 [Phyllosticta citribraziliensis]